MDEETAYSRPAQGVEAPIAWRVEWLRAFNPRTMGSKRPKPSHRDFRTQDEAEAAKRQIALDDQVAVCVHPVFISKAKREALYDASQDSLTASGWPVQMAPPKPWKGAKKQRRRR